MLHQYYPTPEHEFKFELNKDLVVASAHYIPHEEAGKCRFVHGHNYTINLTIVGDNVDDLGFLVNFSDLKKVVSDKYDHKTLNNLSDFSRTPPSTELFARQIMTDVAYELGKLPHNPRCIQVIVRETDSSYVRYVDRRFTK
jgi:6-pyruvoyltetrahydropterin/6-carboxytetrahydropterin synthase